MPSTIAIPHLFALALVAGAAFCDARTGHIPNGLTLPPLLLAPLAYLLASGPVMAAMSLLAAVVCAIVPYLMFRKGAAGGGDVKLLAAIGAIGGASFGIETMIFGFTIAAFVSLMILTFRGKLAKTLLNALFLALNPFVPKRFRRVAAPEVMSTIRMGVPFLAGAFIALWLRIGAVG